MSFRFRKFVVEDSVSTMKVGTDAMLLGSWVEPQQALNILDVGTGCGVLALMMAQESLAQIDAIDIHEPSVKEAQYNISRSPWAERINVFPMSFEEYSHHCLQSYDIIISNPPFFRKSLKPFSSRKLLAKHENSLSYDLLAAGSLKMMRPGASLYLILPAAEASDFTALALAKGLFPVKQLRVRPLASKPPHRILLKYNRNNQGRVSEGELTVHKAGGSYSEEYLALTRNFHLFP